MYRSSPISNSGRLSDSGRAELQIRRSLVGAYASQAGEEVPHDRRKIVELFDIQREGVRTLYELPNGRAQLAPAYRDRSAGGSRGPHPAARECLDSRLEAIFTNGDIVPRLRRAATAQAVDLRMAVEALKCVWRSYVVIEPQLLGELLAAHQVETAMREGLTSEVPQPQSMAPLHVFETLGSVCGIELEMPMLTE